MRHGRPAGDVIRAAELAPILSRPFRVIGGRVSLVGCLFEDIPFLEVTGAKGDKIWFDPWGQQVTDRFAHSIGLDCAEPITRPPATWSNLRILAWEEEIKQKADGYGQPIADSLVVWCKWVSGKLEFRVGEVSTEHAFEGWARLFFERVQRLPAWTCPATGLSGDVLELTDDGELTVPHAIRCCGRSGRRRIETHLERIRADRWVSSEYLMTCPLTRDRCEPETLVACDQCGGKLSPAGIYRNTCVLCREARSLVSGTRWAQWLERCQSEPDATRWQVGERENRVVLVRRGWLGRELWLLEADSGNPLAHRIRRGWGRWRDVERAS